MTHAESTEAARETMRRFRASWRTERREGRLTNARANLELWIDETDDTLAGIHWDSLVRGWDRLDTEQRAQLREEAARLARSDGTLDTLRALPN